MTPLEGFDRIVSALYASALDDAHWSVASALIDEAVGAAGNALIVGEGARDDARLYFARFLYRGEQRPDEVRAYFDTYHPHDEGMPRLRTLSPARLIPIADLYSDAELKTSPAYSEGLGLLDCRNGLIVQFDGADGLRTVWGVGDPVGGDWQSDRIALIERLLPHVIRAVGIRQALAAAGALGASLTGLLDNNRIGVLQLDRGGRLLTANGPAMTILRRGDSLVDDGGTLQARLPADRSRLHRLLGRALPRLWGETPSGGSMMIQRPSGPPRLGLHVSPVGDAETDFGGRRVAALVLLVDPARRPRIDASRVTTMLGLSDSEGRVAALVAEGRTAREIAAVTGYRESYVRWLIQQVYRKQGLSGQVALVQRVLAVDALPRG